MTPAAVYRIEVTLKHGVPHVCRRTEVPADIVFGSPHEVHQKAMGGSDSRLHVFRAGPESFAVAHPDLPDGDSRGERNVRPDRIAREGDRLIYDSAPKKVGNTRSKSKRYSHPTQTGARWGTGTRPCPHEDCEGPVGYRYRSRSGILGEPMHGEHGKMRERIGGGFDPEAFDAEARDEQLSRMRQGWSL